MSTGNVIRGHKATISNPNTSQAAKEHSRQVLLELEGQSTDTTNPSRQTRLDDGEEEVTVETDRPNVTGDNVRHEGVLADTGPAVEDSSFVGKEPNRVLGGFKAALHNPNTSKEAKDHAKAKLDQHGVAVE